MTFLIASREDARMAAYWNGSLRGFMLKNRTDSNPHTQQDYADLAATGANVARVPFSLTKVDGRYPYPTDEIAYVRQVLDYGTQYGFRVIPVMVPLPTFGDSEWWTDLQLQADLTTVWVAVAAAIKDHPALIGYDLINEPVGPITFNTANKLAWLDISEPMAQAIRAEDPTTPILWEPFWWGKPGSFWLYPRAPAVSNLVASCHWYDNQDITHQGLPTYPAAGTESYPTATEHYAANYARMVEARNFSRNFGVPMFVGEYSCVRWAPVGTTEAWINDAHKLFRAERWGSCYHAWRAYDGWDSEIAQSVPQDTGTASDRSSANPVITLLRAWFAEN